MASHLTKPQDDGLEPTSRIASPSHELANTSEHVKAMWRYAIVLAMIDDEKARATRTRVEDGRVLLSVRSVAGDEFEIERPPMSEETERELLQQIREIVADD